MITYNNIWEQLCSYDNISDAIDGVLDGRKSKALVYDDIRYCRVHRDEVIKEAQKEFNEGTYDFSNYYTKEIIDGCSKKHRDIVCPRVLYNQIFHHAIVQVIEPVIRKGMYEWSCANIKYRGIIYAKERVEKFVRTHPHECKYWMKLDIHHYYPSIPHDKIYNFCKTHFTEPKMQNLLHSLIYCWDSPEGEGLGIPIGFYTSQWLANWYLQDLDHYICEQIKDVYGYTRYADDMVLFSSNKCKLRKAKELIEQFLNNKGLTLNDKWQIARFDYHDKKQDKQRGRFLDFVGYRFYRDKTTLRSGTYHRIIRKLNKQCKVKNINWYNSCQTMSYLARLKSCNMYGILSYYLQRLPMKQMIKTISRHSKQASEKARETDEIILDEIKQYGQAVRC